MGFCALLQPLVVIRTRARQEFAEDEKACAPYRDSSHWIRLRTKRASSMTPRVAISRKSGRATLSLQQKKSTAKAVACSPPQLEHAFFELPRGGGESSSDPCDKWGSISSPNDAMSFKRHVGRGADSEQPMMQVRRERRARVLGLCTPLPRSGSLALTLHLHLRPRTVAADSGFAFAFAFSRRWCARWQ